MGTRGRTSAAALEIIAPSSIQTIERLKPPHDLHDEEVEVWVNVVNNEPADWFSPATAPLLTQYCRHVVHGRRVSELLERALSDPELSLRDHDRLLQMLARESNTIATLATKMRIAQQSTRTHRGNQTSTGAPRKPWQRR